VEKAVEGGAHWRWGKQRGPAAMWPVAACCGAGEWTRRQGSATGPRPLSRRRGNGEGEKKGHGGGDAHFNRLGGVEQRGGEWPGVAPRGEEVEARRGGPS
jgi:hypothetical protein